MIISFSILLLTILVGAVIILMNRRKIFEERETKPLRLAIVIVVAGILIALIQPYTLSRVDAGHVGVKVNLSGDERGVSDYSYEVGWVVYNTYTENLYQFPVYQRHIEYNEQIVITKGGFAATIKPTFNYTLKNDMVGDMFTSLRLPIEQVENGWLQNAVGSSVNDVANKWEVDAIFNKREEFEAAIIAECNKRVGKWFIVTQLRTNITPPPALREQIENKTKSIQEAQAKKQAVLVAEAEGERKVAVARADSAQAVINASGKAEALKIQAQGEADAIKLRQQQLSPLYIEYQRINKWNGAYPSTMLGSGSNTLFQVK